MPAPRNSAQHLSAALYHSHVQAQQATDSTVRPPAAPPVLAPRQHTRELTRDDWQQPFTRADYEYQGVSGHFAGIEMSEFYWARQRARRALLFWVVAVLTLTGLIAAAAWTLGGNIATLI